MIVHIYVNGIFKEIFPLLITVYHVKGEDLKAMLSIQDLY